MLNLNDTDKLVIQGRTLIPKKKVDKDTWICRTMNGSKSEWYDVYIIVEGPYMTKRQAEEVYK